VEEHGQSEAVALFREHVLGDAALLTAVRRELRGRDLACWCKPGEPCHADVLLELANPKPEPQGDQLGLFELGAAQLLQLEQAAAALALGDQQQAQGPPGRGS
jgi:hypothetical protein